MVFADTLRNEAKRFRENVLGVPYLGVHMRRSDFVSVRKNDIPSIDMAITQVGLCGACGRYSSVGFAFRSFGLKIGVAVGNDLAWAHRPLCVCKATNATAKKRPSHTCLCYCSTYSYAPCRSRA